MFVGIVTWASISFQVLAPGFYLCLALLLKLALIVTAYFKVTVVIQLSIERLQIAGAHSGQGLPLHPHSCLCEVEGVGVSELCNVVVMEIGKLDWDTI